MSSIVDVLLQKDLEELKKDPNYDKLNLQCLERKRNGSNKILKYWTLTIQGDENSPKQLFGVHTAMFMQGIYRMENAEIRHCGQSFNFGKYCTHSHRGGDMSGSYVKANSIHHSFQRAVTTHDTNNWEVSSFIQSLAMMFIQYVHD
jgi:hypothetical protein